MALELKQTIITSQDASVITQRETTGSGLDGWGYLGNPQRSDNALVFFAAYIDSSGNRSYLELVENTQDPDKVVGVIPGDGLTNDDTSEIKVVYGTDGHYIFYAVRAENSIVPFGGNTGDIYYDTNDLVVYIFDGSGFVELSKDTLDLIVENNEDLFYTQRLLDLKLRMSFNKKLKDLYNPTRDYNRNLRDQLMEIVSKQFLYTAAFVEGSYSTARELLEQTEDLL